MLVEFKLLKPEAQLPVRATAGSAAFDLFCREPASIHPGTVQKLHLGFAMALELGSCALILPRSGLATSLNLRPANTPGLIDSDYRGEIIVALENFGNSMQHISKGTRIAQMLIVQIPWVIPQTVKSLPETARGSGGFGSTGEGDLS